MAECFCEALLGIKIEVSQSIKDRTAHFTSTVTRFADCTIAVNCFRGPAIFSTRPARCSASGKTIRDAGPNSSLVFRSEIQARSATTSCMKRVILNEVKDLRRAIRFFATLRMTATYINPSKMLWRCGLVSHGGIPILKMRRLFAFALSASLRFW